MLLFSESVMEVTEKDQTKAALQAEDLMIPAIQNVTELVFQISEIRIQPSAN